MENLESEIEVDIKIHGCMMVDILLSQLDDSEDLAIELRELKEKFCKNIMN